jgi:nucleoid-associated protein YgaU
VDLLAAIDGSTPPAVVEKPTQPAPVEAPAPVETPALLPASYTVRPWAVSKDCFWNIAGRSWVYGDPYKWRLLYNANKSKLPDPNNPDLIEPDMVLDIPSLQGEGREGAWDADKTYPPLD